MLAALFALLHGPAAAADFGYSPAVVTLDPGTRSTLVRIANLSDLPLRIELENQRWDQTGDGDPVLSPNDDLLITPAVMTIPAHRAAFVHVALLAQREAHEGSYRLLVAELPPFFADGDAPGVAVRSAVNVPVFVSTLARPTVSGTIAGAVVRGGALTFDVSNTGSVHFRNEHVIATALGATGQPLFDRALEAWYVLPGQSRHYRLAIPAASCRSIRAVHIAVDGGVRLDTTIDVDPGSCS